MNLDMGNVFKEMAAAADNALQGEVGSLGGEILSVLNMNRESLSELAAAYSCGDITEEEFDVELQREKSILEAEMLSLEIAPKSAVQKAMNVAMDTLKQAANKARPN
ncbi:hypothetical protein [Desulfoluna spongiiphila]|uniref:Uncharacterized protein n=1 Tax=Desulfoluna spongiiphila TaxID=419481 RepID=A0A1G5INY5_9BACT|nr:hypothetical protein [Desulfoluna spongiiphila]SCY77634.1 hypothetical protein SAMN05216233_1218 [Desulfoluna spongiiphila]VVS92612.1 hypothetical protein DBB_21800 [Desulfoluna spongiiphila]